MREAGIGIVSMKTSGPIRKDPKAYEDKYPETFGGQELSPYQRAYAFMLSRGGVDAFISHMPNHKILEENLAVPALKLSRAELDRIETQALAEARGACRHCGACNQACDQGVNVSDMLRYHAYAHGYGEPDVARELYQIMGKSRAPRCTACGACQAACPESIDLASVIRSVRVELA
jgi:predicted aldo/keto reductase-like oxidoreductase